jgi:biotin carboxyl carrier protein
MKAQTLTAQIQPSEEDPAILVISSPAVGESYNLVREGKILHARDRILRLKVMGVPHDVLLPEHCDGRVTELLISRDLSPINYGTPLLKLDQRIHYEERTDSQDDAASGKVAQSEGILITSPSEGIFYRRPSPDSPPYVDEGSVVKEGQTLGLVEVMKCFNQVLYQGDTLPAAGRIAEVLAEDTSEVNYGQPLFRIVSE